MDRTVSSFPIKTAGQVAEEMVDSWESQGASGSLTLHFNNGKLAKVEERRFVSIVIK